MNLHQDAIDVLAAKAKDYEMEANSHQLYASDHINAANIASEKAYKIRASIAVLSMA